MTHQTLDHADTLLLGHVADGSPCGPDIEYSPSFLELMTIAQGRQELQLGDSIIPAQEPDWRAVMGTAQELLCESRDLRVACTLAQAATHVHGVNGLSEVLALIASWLETHWDDLHPRLMVENEYDPLMRVNAVASLSDPNGMLRTLRASVLLECRSGALTFGEIDNVLKGKPKPGALISSQEQLSRFIASERIHNQARLDALARARHQAERLQRPFRQALDAEYWPNLEPLLALLQRLDDALTPASGAASSQPAADEVMTNNSFRLSGDESPRTRLPSHIDNRTDAFTALAIARTYFERYEPSHPAPLLIRRIERLIDLDFAEILAELAPEGMRQLELVAGSANSNQI